MQNGKAENISPLVAVWMVTYNHEKFIEQSVESIMSQKTSFNFLLILGEDGSTDNTGKLCLALQEKYAGKIELLLHKKNIGGTKNALNVYEACFATGAKYIAMCEGDDYWTDAHKLQKQVDFLEANNDYTICWTKYKILNDDSSLQNIIQKEPDWETLFENKERFEVSLENIFKPYATHTLTVMFRSAAFDLKQFLVMKHRKDNNLFCMCLSKGKGTILNFFGGVYRLHGYGIFTSASFYQQCITNFLNLEEIICKIPNCNNKNLKTRRNRQLVDAFDACLRNQRSGDFTKLIFLYYKILLYCTFNYKLKAAKTLSRQAMLLVKTSNKKAIGLESKANV